MPQQNVYCTRSSRKYLTLLQTSLRNHLLTFEKKNVTECHSHSGTQLWIQAWACACLRRSFIRASASGVPSWNESNHASIGTACSPP